jgi:hypothetical protein
MRTLNWIIYLPDTIVTFLEAFRAVKKLGIQIFFSDQDEKNICLGKKEKVLFNSFDDSVKSLSDLNGR